MDEPLEHGMTPSQTELLRLLSRQLFRASVPSVENPDWEQVLREAEENTVYAEAFTAAESELPPELAASGMQRFYQVISGHVKVSYAHRQAHEAMTAAGIPYTVLKGCSSASYYPAAGLRAMGDVDLYVHREDLERAETALLKAGYRVCNKDHSNHWVYAKDGIELELHWNVTGVPTEGSEPILRLLDDLIETSSERDFEGNVMVLPDVFHHGLVILLHVASHLTADGVGLRHLTDWLVFEQGMSEAEFRERFEPALRNVGLWEFAKVLSAIGAAFFGCEKREYFSDVSPELTEAMLRDILAGGNFGEKDLDRLNQSKLLRDNESRRVGRGHNFTNAIRFLNQRARERVPASRKLPILLPIGWAAVYRRHKNAVRTGLQAPVHLRRTLDSARERQSIYEQLRLFEPSPEQPEKSSEHQAK